MTRHRLMILLAIAVALGLAVAFWPAPIERTPPADATAPLDDGTDDGAPLEPAPADAGTTQPPEPAFVTDPAALERLSIEEMQRRIDDLELALDAAINERKSAEAGLQQSERDVAALERFVEEIEERGEDPVDYAEEGLEKFQPAFEQYQQSFNRLEQAEIMEETARDALARARKRLDELKREAGRR